MTEASTMQPPDIELHGERTVPGLFWKRVTGLPNKVALREKDFGIWNEYTWRDYGEQARLVGLGLQSLGLQRGEVCSIASEVNQRVVLCRSGRDLRGRRGERGLSHGCGQPGAIPDHR